MNLRPWICAFFACIAAAPVSAQEGRGFAELRMSAFPGATGQPLQFVERVRPTLETELAERVKLVATIEAGLRQGRDPSREVERMLHASPLQPLLDLAECRWPTYQNSFFRIDSAGDYLAVDRFFIDAYAGALDVRVGRQALNWGSAQFFNPTDPFPEVLLAEPWRERRGVNAARATLPFGENHDATVVVGTSDTLNELRAAGRVRLHAWGADFAAVAVYRGAHRNGLVGVDIRGTLEVGYWLEAAYLLGESAHEEIAAGIDYSFPILERATAFIQYYRNGSGVTSPDQYARGAEFAAIRGPTCANGVSPRGAGSQRDPFAPFTHARDYVIGGATLLILPELSHTLAWVQNLDDGTGLLVPTVSYNALDWLDLALSAQIPYAAGPHGGEFKPRHRDLQYTTQSPTGETLRANLSGLVPAATVTFWTRASF